jgi:hypothetical protein
MFDFLSKKWSKRETIVLSHCASFQDKSSLVQKAVEERLPENITNNNNIPKSASTQGLSLQEKQRYLISLSTSTVVFLSVLRIRNYFFRIRIPFSA